jgi:hypothetical protein
MNAYICLYRGKRYDVYAVTNLEAQKLAAAHFKAKKAYEVDVYLAEKDGEQVEHVAEM